MHRLWQIPELLVQIISLLPASDIDYAFLISHYFYITLKANLPPHLHPLPDHSPQRLRHERSLPQDVRDKARAFETQDAALPEPLKMTDSYFHWNEGARERILYALKPCLHPVLCKYTTQLFDVWDALAEGLLKISLRTDMPRYELYQLLHTNPRAGDWKYLAIRPPTAVTIVFLDDSDWDLSFANFRFRDYGGEKRLSVRVERECGVRMCDVFDELRGALLVGGISGDERDLALWWIFDDHATVATASKSI